VSIKCFVPELSSSDEIGDSRGHRTLTAFIDPENKAAKLAKLCCTNYHKSYYAL
jgi:hypothetical protein